MRLFPGRQRGATLIIALIMLVLMTLFAINTFNLGKSSLLIVGNMQARAQATAAANGTIEEVISRTDFFKTPAASIVLPCAAGANTRCYDINGDGINDITVTLTPQPTCVMSQTIRTAELKLSLAADVACTVGVSQSFGVMGIASGDSLCANSVWEITAEAVDSVTRAKATVTQGVGVRVSTDDIAANCP